MLDQGTGITTYARALIGESTELLLDRMPGTEPAGSRPRRYARAVTTRWRPLQTRLEGEIRLGDDVFRVAQVHFDIWRRLLRLSGPALPDVMHWSSPVPVHMPGVPNLYTIMDTIPLDHVTSTDPGRFLRILRAIAAVADHVVTISEAARADILRWLPNLVGRISVVSPVVRIAPVDATIQAQALTRFGLTERRFYLFVGSTAPHKNVAALASAVLASGSPYPLILVGPNDQPGSFTEAGPSVPVRHLGYLPREVLTGLMQTARALLFPSLAEGFGLPIIEAMTLGTPVMTSDRGAPREVAGAAALLVDPTDPRAMRAAIVALDNDDTLRTKLARLGTERAADYSPARQHAAMEAIYRSLADGKPRPSI